VIDSSFLCMRASLKFILRWLQFFDNYRSGCCGFWVRGVGMGCSIIIVSELQLDNEEFDNISNWSALGLLGVFRGLI
jgi:hypothetical protein